MFIEEQGALLSAITDRLEVVAPPGWNRLDLKYMTIGDNDFGGSSAVVFNKREQVIGIWKPPSDVDDMFAQLRAGMARPERGAWIKAEYFLYYPDYYSIEYFRDIPSSNFHSEHLPSPSDCARELELFPRAAEHIPSWMQELLEKARDVG
ncbi:hypothetical protein ACFVVM_16285 [Nocardia sp. NPDC058176]|uniref:hypothetical protein n=1 Tax=Nocardia sp. NPDC058176 TaxID=3346368 RepID=UPI0036DF1037